MVENNEEELVQGTLDEELGKISHNGSKKVQPAYEPEENDYALRRRLQQEANCFRNKKPVIPFRSTRGRCGAEIFYKDQLDAAQGSKKGAIKLARYREARLNK